MDVAEPKPSGDADATSAAAGGGVAPSAEPGDAQPLASVLAAAQETGLDGTGALFSLLYQELHGAAARLMGGHRAGHTLQPTALVHEAWVRLIAANAGWRDQVHFVASVVKTMRTVLLDHARAKRATRRGGPDSRRVPLDAVLDVHERAVGFELVALDAALQTLAATRPQEAFILELHVFGGMRQSSIAALLALSLSTVELRLREARKALRTLYS